MVSGTIEATGTMLAGQNADAFWTSIAHGDLLSVGLELRHRPGVHDRPSPDAESSWLRPAFRAIRTRACRTSSCNTTRHRRAWRRSSRSSSAHGWLNLVGGCCGTTDAHIRAIAQMVEGRKPRAVKAREHRAYYSGIEPVEAEDSNRPLIVGERTNVIGSRAFKKLIAEEKWEQAAEIARQQVKNGAHVIDVCLQSTDRDEMQGHSAVLRAIDPAHQSADHDRHHRPAGDRSWRSLIARARASSTRSTWKTAKRSSSASVRLRALTARR